MFEHAAGRRKFDVQNIVARWLSRGEGRNSKTIKVELVLMRQFAIFLKRQDPARVVLDIARLPPLPRPRRFQPHIFGSPVFRVG